MILENFDFATFLLYFIIAGLVVYLVRNSYCSNGAKYLRTGKYKMNIHVISVWIILTVFASVRLVDKNGLGGADAALYVEQFLSYDGNLSYYLDWNKIKTFNIREPLYYLSIHIIRWFTNDYHVWFFLLYGIIAIGFLYFIRNFLEIDSAFLVVLIPFCNYLHSFNVMRNWIAIAISLAAVVKLSQGKNKQYLLLSFAASGFHYSALVMYLFYACYKIINRFYVKKFNMIMLAIGLNFITIPIAAAYSYLFKNNKFRFYIGMKSSGIGYIMTIFIWLVGIVLYKSLIRRKKKNLLIMVGLSFNIGFMYLITNMGMYRINDFFSLFKMYILSEFICVVKEKYKGITRNILVMSLYLFVILYSFQLLFNYIETSHIMPYMLGGI